MNVSTLLKILNFYVRFTPNYTKIGYFARRLTWGRSAPLDFAGQRWKGTYAALRMLRCRLSIAARIDRPTQTSASAVNS